MINVSFYSLKRNHLLDAINQMTKSNYPQREHHSFSRRPLKLSLSCQFHCTPLYRCVVLVVNYYDDGTAYNWVGADDRIHMQNKSSNCNWAEITLTFVNFHFRKTTALFIHVEQCTMRLPFVTIDHMNPIPTVYHNVLKHLIYMLTLCKFTLKCCNGWFSKFEASYARQFQFKWYRTIFCNPDGFVLRS